MTVRAGSHWSTPRPVNAGAPQGSVLGTYMFNVGTDKLEQGFAHTNNIGMHDLEEHDLSFLETASNMARQTSTPTRGQNTTSDNCPFTPIRGEQRIELLPRVRNPPQSRRVEPSWRHKAITVRKFVDDNITTEKLRIKEGTTYEDRESTFKNVRAMQSERPVSYTHLTLPTTPYV